MTTFFGILTKVGEAKEANAKALGVPVLITELEVGDGGGVSPTPDREQTALIGPKRRAQINRSFVDPSNPAWLVIEQVIPEQVGGWWIRELGLRDADGDLIAVANCPPTYKPQLAEGSARTQVVRMVLQVSSSNDFTLKVDPAVVLATRGYVDAGLLLKLDKDGTAVAATKLAAGRKISVSGGATAVGVAFDGTVDIEIKVTALDVSKANAGILGVVHGGTGLKTIADKEILVGTAAGGYARKSPEEVRKLIGAPKVCSIFDLPAEDIGPVLVAECSEVWVWTATAFYTGYRSPLCGRPLDGHTAVPLVSEVDGIGGLLNKVTYSRLWGYAQENSLVVSQAVWTANIGAHYFVDVNATQFRVPDLRNIFRRFTGTDADTANARQFGSWQFDATQRTVGTLDGFNDFSAVSGVFDHSNPVPGEQATAGTGTQYHGLSFDNARVARTSSETRPKNTAFHPRIHA